MKSKNQLIIVGCLALFTIVVTLLKAANIEFSPKLMIVVSLVIIGLGIYVLVIMFRKIRKK